MLWIHRSYYLGAFCQVFFQVRCFHGQTVSSAMCHLWCAILSLTQWFYMVHHRVLTNEKSCKREGTKRAQKFCIAGVNIFLLYFVEKSKRYALKYSEVVSWIIATEDRDILFSILLIKIHTNGKQVFQHLVFVTLDSGVMFFRAESRVIFLSLTGI